MNCLLGCEELVSELMRRGDFLPVLAVVMGCAVGMIAIICGSVSGTMKARVRERTRQELAAYVAEGSMSADQAAALMDAGGPKDESTGCC